MASVNKCHNTLVSTLQRYSFVGDEQHFMDEDHFGYRDDNSCICESKIINEDVNLQPINKKHQLQTNK